jgi:hypothetical protein
LLELINHSSLFPLKTLELQLSVGGGLGEDVSAIVNGFRGDKTSLVFLAWSLNELSQCIEHLSSQVHRVAVDELFLIGAEHGGNESYKIESPWVDLNPVAQLLLSQMILEAGVMPLDH